MSKKRGPPVASDAGGSLSGSGGAKPSSPSAPGVVHDPLAASRLSAIVESSNDAIISKDLNGVIMTWNRGAERLFGYRAEEIIGRNVSLLIPPDRMEEEERILTLIGSGQRVEHYQTVRRRKDGSAVDISLTVSPIRDAEGRVVGASKIARDIGEHVRDQEFLRRSEELFRVTLSSIGDAVMSTDHRGRVTFLNPVAERLTGWKWQDAVGYPLEQSFRIFDELTREPVPSPVARVLHTGAVVSMTKDTILVAKDGTERPIDDSAAPIRNAERDLIGVVMVFRDVSEQRSRMVAAERLAAFVASSNDAIYSVTVPSGSRGTGTIQSWNRAAELLLGYTGPEILGRPLAVLIPADLRESEARVVARLQRGERVAVRETRRLAKGGRELQVSVISSLLRDGRGRLVAVSETARDITQRKRGEAALRQSEALKTAILNAGLDAVITIDRSTAVVEFNAAAEQIFGHSRQDALGKKVGDLIVPPRHRDAHERGVARYLETGESHILGRRVEMSAMRADGSEFPCELAILRVPLEGPPLFTASVRDITARKRTEEALRQSEEQFRTLADNIPQLAWIADKHGSVFWYNKRWYEYTGTTLEEVEGWGWKKAHHPDHVGRIVARLQAAWDSGQPWEDIFPLRGADGDYRWFLSRARPIRDASGEVVRWLGTLTDITAQHTTEEALRRGALHDALTDLPNRTYFTEQVAQALARTRRDPGHRIAVLLLDCDGFKSINDSLGHAAGDRLLAEIAARLRASVRPGDVVARLGGDEFTILLERVAGASDVEQAARHIQEALAAPLALGGREIVTTASIGAALGEADHTQPQDLLRDADLAMYRAKQQGRANFHLFDAALRDSVQARAAMESDLRNALERREFRLVFQPIVELVSGRVRAVEALLRWQHPKRGIVLPREWVAIAEETGLILPIGRWVLSEACRHARAWQQAAPVGICVNISTRQLLHPEFVEEVGMAIQESAVPPASLILEIAERDLVASGESSMAVLQRLRDLGVGVHLDDFGITASPSHLSRVPVQGIKLDPALVHNMGARRTDHLAIVRSIVELARGLGLGLIAEGVETIAQRERLIEFGCELGQGHLFAKPLKPTAVRALLTHAA